MIPNSFKMVQLPLREQHQSILPSKRILGSAGCQPARLGSLPRRAARRLALETILRATKVQPASCRLLQAGSLRSPEQILTPLLGIIELASAQASSHAKDSDAIVL
jgi:hypothetical protein